MPEVKYNPAHHAGGTPEARIAGRLRNSGEGAGTTPDVIWAGKPPFERFTTFTTPLGTKLAVKERSDECRRHRHAQPLLGFGTQAD